MRATAVKVGLALVAVALVGLMLRAVSSTLANALASPAEGATMRVSPDFTTAVVTDDQESSSGASCIGTADVFMHAGRPCARIVFPLPYAGTEEEAAAVPGSTFLLDGLTFKSGTTPGFTVKLPGRIAGLSFGLNVTGPKLTKQEKQAALVSRGVSAELAALGITKADLAALRANKAAAASGAPGVTRVAPGVTGEDRTTTGDVLNGASVAQAVANAGSRETAKARNR